MRLRILVAALTAGLIVSANVSAGKPVGITPDMKEVTFTHGGEKHTIMRNQDNKNTVNPAFAKTSRPCPPFCIQPIVLTPGVETIAEVEVIGYIKKMADGDDSILVVDSRTPGWVKKGTIPGAVNLPWTSLNPNKGATTEGIVKILTEEFGAKLKGDNEIIDVDDAIVNNSVGEVIDYSDAKTLVMFCNGMWCGQSPNSIMNLLRFDYPAEKIKWYRGGMQDWEILGLSTVPGGE